MRLNAVKMLGISITTNSKKEILEEIQKYLLRTQNSELRTQKNLIIVTPNPEQIVYAQKDKHFAQVLNRADIAIPDGIGIVLANQLLNKKTKLQRTPGVEFMENLVQMAAEWGFPIRLIGGKGKLAVETFECLSRRWPNLATAEKPKMVFVALGAPKQEYFIEEAAKRTTGVVYMAVGGSFDIISGRLPRAPSILQTIGLEWLWRLVLEPWRLRRQLALVRFLSLVLKEWLHV